MTNPPPRATFFAGVLAGAAPMLVWSAHFAFCYVATAVGCTAIARGGALTASSLQPMLVAGTAGALAAAAVLLVRACRAGVREPAASLLGKVRLSAAVLALVGIAWTGLPLAFLPPCG
jgi:hypothetical protein